MDKIDIIMATYNGQAYIKEQIESILENTYQEWQLTVCDDGSLDNTISIVKEYMKQYPDKIFLYENPKNLGVILNFLQAVKKSNNPYIMFCDQDDVWKSNKIQVTYEKMKEMESDVGDKLPIAVFSDGHVVDSKLNIIHPSFHKSGALDVSKIDLSSILMENKLLGCTTMLNKRVREMIVTLPTTARMHDWWIGIICASFGRIGFVNEATILYRQHDNNIVGGSKDFTSYVKDRISSLNKQRQVLKLTQNQAKNFYQIYKGQLSPKYKDVIYQFAMLGKKNWFIRRYILLKYKFFKTGVIRNIGVFLLI